MTSDFVLSRDDGDAVPAHLLTAWEATYRDYLAVSERMDNRDVGSREDLPQISARVAVAWRRMGEATPEVAWWLRAVLFTAAEAMEQQARVMGIRARRSS
jgi:hypothetical protein